MEKAPRGRALTGSGAKDELSLFEGITVDGGTGGRDGREGPELGVCYGVREGKQRYLRRF